MITVSECYRDQKLFDAIHSSYRDVVEQAFRMGRITKKTRNKLLESSRIKRESDHLLKVSFHVHFHKSADVSYAALNHDTIENGLLSYRDILESLGKRTADLVAGVTDFRYVDKQGNFLREWVQNRGLRELAWRERKEASLKRLRKSDNTVVALKLVDAEDELRIIKEYGISGYEAGWDDLKWYYGELLKLFEGRIRKGKSKTVLHICLKKYRERYRELFCS